MKTNGKSFFQNYQTLNLAKINYLNEIYKLIAEEDRPNSAAKTELQLKVTQETMKQFMTSYPAISWLEVTTNVKFRKYALLGDYHQWIYDSFPKTVPVFRPGDFHSYFQRWKLLKWVQNKEALEYLIEPFKDPNFGTNAEQRLFKLQELYISPDHANIQLSVPLVNWLIDHGVSPLIRVGSSVDYKYVGSIIHIRDIDLIKKLIKMYPEIRWNSMPILIRHIAGENEEIFDILVEKGFSPRHIVGENLVTTVKRGNIKFLKRLIDAGAYTTSMNLESDIFHVAIQSGNKEIIDYFISINGSPFTLCNLQVEEKSGNSINKTTVVTCAFAKSVSNPEIFRYLLEKLQEIPKESIKLALKEAMDYGNIDLYTMLADRYKRIMESEQRKVDITKSDK